MTIYNTIFKLLKANKGSLLLGIAITAFITFTQSSIIDDEPLQLRKANVVVLMEETTPVTEALTNYLTNEQEVVSLPDTSEQSLDDALYFGKVSYIVTIPQSFTDALNAGKLPQLQTRTRPGTFSETLVDSTINQFLNTYLLYQKAQPDAGQATWLAQTEKTLATTATMHLNDAYQQKHNQSIAGRLVNLLAYGLFATIFSAYGLVNLSFNRTEIKMRNSCSPVSRRKLSRKIATANFAYALVVALGFSGFILYFSKVADHEVLGLFSLNIAAFFLTMVAFSTMITSLVNNNEAISGISNIVILGSCFISGIFVPSEILPEIVNKIAAFTPTYWFARSNQLIGDTLTHTQTFYQELGLNLLVLLAFAAAFSVIHLMNMRDKGSAVLTIQKRTAR